MRLIPPWHVSLEFFDFVTILKERQKELAAGLCEVFKPEADAEQLPIGFGTIISKVNQDGPKKEAKCLVLFNMEEIEHLKAFVELARLGLEMKDKKREERQRREKEMKKRAEEEKRRKTEAAQLKLAANTESSAAALSAAQAVFLLKYLKTLAYFEPLKYKSFTNLATSRF